MDTYLVISMHCMLLVMVTLSPGHFEVGNGNHSGYFSSFVHGILVGVHFAFT